MARFLGFLLGIAAATLILVSPVDEAHLAELTKALKNKLAGPTDRAAQAVSGTASSAAATPGHNDKTPAMQASPKAQIGEAGTEIAREPEVQQQTHWQGFWNRFHSEISARGFAERLGRLTGHEYRVQESGPGVYEVVFPYRDPAERQARLERIEAATGFRLLVPGP